MRYKIVSTTPRGSTPESLRSRNLHENWAELLSTSIPSLSISEPLKLGFQVALKALLENKETVLSAAQASHLCQLSIVLKLENTHPIVRHHFHQVLESKGVNPIPFFNPEILEDFGIENALPDMISASSEKTSTPKEIKAITSAQKKRISTWKTMPVRITESTKRDQPIYRLDKEISFYTFQRGGLEFKALKETLVKEDQDKIYEKETELVLEAADGQYIKIQFTDIDHADPFHRILQRLGTLITYLNDPENRSILDLILKHPDYKDFFVTGDDTRVYASQYLLASLYNFRDNLLLTSSLDNRRKGDQDLVTWLESQAFYKSGILHYLLKNKHPKSISTNDTEKSTSTEAANTQAPASINELIDRSGMFLVVNSDTRVDRQYRGQAMAVIMLDYMASRHAEWPEEFEVIKAHHLLLNILQRMRLVAQDARGKENESDIKNAVHKAIDLCTKINPTDGLHFLNREMKHILGDAFSDLKQRFDILSTPSPKKRKLAREEMELPEAMGIIDFMGAELEQEKSLKFQAIDFAEKEKERAEKEKERAEKERERAEKERERAEKERERADALQKRLQEALEKLTAAGISP